jgi:protein-disulfide isomerase
MSTTEWEAVLTMPVSEDRDHVQGPADAPVTLVEYGDFECPYCGAAYPIVKQVQDRMGERLRFVFRHFPISTSHPNAEQAAEAAEAAAAQGRFWPMHDLLFETSVAWATATSAATPSSSGSASSGSTATWPSTSTPRGSMRTS